MPPCLLTAPHCPSQVFQNAISATSAVGIVLIIGGAAAYALASASSRAASASTGTTQGTSPGTASAREDAGVLENLENQNSDQESGPPAADSCKA